MKVFVYWNLHRGLWSIKALEGPDKGRVIDRMPTVFLRDVQGKVSEAGRQRVLRDNKKNVHAGIVGIWESNMRGAEIGRRLEWIGEWIGDKVTYNPYLYDRFVHDVDESPFEGSAYAVLCRDRSVYVVA